MCLNLVSELCFLANNPPTSEVWLIKMLIGQPEYCSPAFHWSQQKTILECDQRITCVCLCLHREYSDFRLQVIQLCRTSLKMSADGRRRKNNQESESRTEAVVAAGLGILVCAAGLAIPFANGPSAAFLGSLVVGLGGILFGNAMSKLSEK